MTPSLDKPEPSALCFLGKAGGMIWRTAQLFGLACLAMVALVHVAERFQIFPGMGWGQPASGGHYLDLVSAVLGCTLLPLGLIGWHLLGEKIQTDTLPAFSFLRI